MVPAGTRVAPSDARRIARRAGLCSGAAAVLRSTVRLCGTRILGRVLPLTFLLLQGCLTFALWEDWDRGLGERLEEREIPCRLVRLVDLSGVGGESRIGLVFRLVPPVGEPWPVPGLESEGRGFLLLRPADASLSWAGIAREGIPVGKEKRLRPDRLRCAIGMEFHQDRWEVVVHLGLSGTADPKDWIRRLRPEEIPPWLRRRVRIVDAPAGMKDLGRLIRLFEERFFSPGGKAEEARKGWILCAFMDEKGREIPVALVASLLAEAATGAVSGVRTLGSCLAVGRLGFQGESEAYLVAPLPLLLLGGDLEGRREGPALRWSLTRAFLAETPTRPSWTYEGPALLAALLPEDFAFRCVRSVYEPKWPAFLWRALATPVAFAIDASTLFTGLILRAWLFGDADLE